MFGKIKTNTIIWATTQLLKIVNKLKDKESQIERIEIGVQLKNKTDILFTSDKKFIIENIDGTEREVTLKDVKKQLSELL